jgi:hypothetical protein
MVSSASDWDCDGSAAAVGGIKGADTGAAGAAVFSVLSIGINPGGGAIPGGGAVAGAGAGVAAGADAVAVAGTSGTFVEVDKEIGFFFGEA